MVLPIPYLKSAVSVDVDSNTGEIYWTDNAEDVIKKYSPDNKKITPIISHELEMVDGIAIDSTGRKVCKTIFSIHVQL